MKQHGQQQQYITQEPCSTSLRRPRVADSARRRAKRACVRCQNRKVRCIIASEGPCSECMRAKALCRFDSVALCVSSPRNDQQIPSPRRTTESNHMLEDDGGGAKANPASNGGFPDLIVEDLSSTRSCGNERFNGLLAQARQYIFQGGSRSAVPGASIVARDTGTRYTSDEAILRQARNALPPYHIAKFLLDVCVEHGTDFMFYFPETQFRQQLHDLYNSPDSPLRLNPSFLCMALAAFSLGCQFADLVRPSLNPSSVALELSAATMFYNAAQRLVPDIVANPNVEAVQALAILSSSATAASARGLCYLHLGLALRIAISLKMHQNEPETATDVDFEVENRTWWTVLLMDRITSLRLGLPDSLLETEITTRLPKRHPALDDGQNDVLAAYIPLTSIWRDIASTIPKLELPLAEAEWRRVQHFADRLRVWKSELAPSLATASSRRSERQAISRRLSHLHQHYHHTWITMCRFALVHRIREHMEGVPHPEPGSSREEQLAQWCVGAAVEIIKLVEMLRKGDRLSAHSFTDLQGCVVSAITMLLYGIVHRDAGYDAVVSSAVASISFIVSRNETLLPVLHFIKGFKNVTEEAYTHCHAKERVSGPAAGDAVLSYEAWLSSITQAVPHDTTTGRPNEEMHRSAEGTWIEPAATLRDLESPATEDPGNLLRWDGLTSLSSDPFDHFVGLNFFEMNDWTAPS